MKKINNIIAILTLSVFALTSCIKEVVPMTSYATSEQIAASASAMEASVNGIPAQMCQGYLVYGEQVHETDMAFPQFMIAFTELLGDMGTETTILSTGPMVITAILLISLGSPAISSSSPATISSVPLILRTRILPQASRLLPVWLMLAEHLTTTSLP